MESISLVNVPIPIRHPLRRGPPDQRSRGGSKRSCEKDLDKDSQGTKRLKMCDLDSVLLQSEGLRKCSKLTEAKPHGHHSKDDGASQVKETAVSSLSDRYVQLKKDHIPEPNGICSSLGLTEISIQSPANLINNVASKQNEEVRECFTDTSADHEPDRRPMCSIGLALDSNENIFHPYKKLGHLISVEASECSSTTGPVEESDPLKMWKAIKQNGFLSSSHGGIPISKQRGRQPKRRKDEELKKKSKVSKKEQSNKYTKIAAPTGLLSGLNPGIIKHVRNSKQVNSIIEAMLQSEKSEDQMQNRSIDHYESGHVGNGANNSAGNHFSLYPNRTSPYTSGSDFAGHRFHHENSTSAFNSEYDDDSLTLKLSSAVTMASENAGSASMDDFPASQDSLPALSLKGASVASQWLDLIQQDIKGRLAVLRRSKMRVRNVIQTELPYILSTEMLPNNENGPCGGHAFEGENPKTEVMNMQMAQWKSIFSQMDKALHEEGNHLETWLKQVQDMQSHCEGGLKYVSEHGLSRIGMPEDSSRPNKTEAVEREHAIRAAAASIYSTCNFITTKENVPCC